LLLLGKSWDARGVFVHVCMYVYMKQKLQDMGQE
jgi:hypothetical protein